MNKLNKSIFPVLIFIIALIIIKSKKNRNKKSKHILPSNVKYNGNSNKNSCPNGNSFLEYENKLENEYDIYIMSINYGSKLEKIK